MNAPTLRSLIPSLAILALVSTARADYLLDPTGGTVLFDGGYNYDDARLARSMGGSFQFFGASISNIYVSTNGNLSPTDNLYGSIDPDNVSLASSSYAMIAPFWDDLILSKSGGQNSVSELTTPGLYAVTWDRLQQFSDDTSSFSFQAALFSSAQTVKGFQFLPGDIAFSYSGIDPLVGDVPSSSYQGSTVGLSMGSGAYSTPFASGGVLQVADRGQLPTGNQFILFRSDGNGGYTASIQAVPEPETFVVLGLGLIALRRRQRRAG